MELLPVTKPTVPTKGKGKKVTCNNNTKGTEISFDKSSAQISHLVYRSWFSRYPRYWYLTYDNGSEFKLYFHALCNTYGITRKPTSVKNPQANALVLECIHAVFTNMLHTAKIDLAIQWKPVTLRSFYQMQHGPFSLPTIQYLKPHQVQQYLDETCSSTFLS